VESESVGRSTGAGSLGRRGATGTTGSRRHPGEAGRVAIAANRQELHFLKELIERAPGVVRVPGSRRAAAVRQGGRGRGVGGTFAGHGNTRGKEGALVGLVFVGKAHRDGFQALEAGGRLEVRALFAAMQFRVALGASAGEVRSRRKGCRAIETSGGGYVLHQTRQAGAGHVDGWAGPWPRGRNPCIRFVDTCGRCPWEG
jgi:hypothetical protein